MCAWASRVVCGLLAFILSAITALAGEPGVVKGRVMNAGGQPVPGAVVEIAGHGQRWKTDDGGNFEAPVPPGDQRLIITSTRYGVAVTPVNVAAGQKVSIDVLLTPVFKDEVVVSTGAAAHTVSEVATPIAVLTADKLESIQQPALGATIAGQPGVSTTSFGPAVGRPVLRGLGNDRVRVLSNGTDVGDMSAGEPDHAVDVNTANADRIEILRGAATLLYGSSAEGGVVNVIDGRIPESRMDRAISGEVTAGFASSADDRHEDVRLEGSINALAWYATVFNRHTGDYHIPGFADAFDPPPGAERGILRNSSIDSRNGVLGLSWVGENGFLGFSVARIEATYGLPGDLQAGGGDPHIVLRQNREDVRGELRRPGSFIESLRINAGFNDYVHHEGEGGIFGQTNSQKSYEGRLEARHAKLGALTGSAGMQVRHRDEAIIGEEAFVPPSTISNAAAFALEELAIGDKRLQGGLRYEQQQIEGNVPTAPRRNYHSLASSLGFVWTPRGAYSVGVSIARAVKFPSVEELYTRGPHISTHSFEIGDANLRPEVDLDTDVSIRKLTGRVAGELNLFVNHFDNFIYQRFTDEPEIEELPVLRYQNAGATFRGAELRVNTLLLQKESRHLSAEFGGDMVHAELARSHEPLPRIPALKIGAGLRYEQNAWTADAGLWHVSRQNRLAPHETPTNAYTTVHASIGLRFYTQHLAHDIVLRGTNLTNAEIRNNTSFLKDVAPQPGRDLELSYRVAF